MKDKVLILLKHDAAPGCLLVMAAACALALANSPLAALYQEFLAIPVNVSAGEFEIAKPLLLWINDGLMAIFFFLVGLEIKRELLEGHLSSPSQVVLPAIAAVGGIAMPALVYVLINSGDEIAMRGWAIPSATDIAFAIGIFSLVGRSLPLTLKLFLLSVAIFDDIGAIVIIALFYTAELSTLSLGVALSGLAALFLLNRLNVRSQAAYLLVGLVVWAAVLKSGVHATLAGFAIAWFIPLRTLAGQEQPMLTRLEHDLHPWVAFMVLPIFAFANAGVVFWGLGVEELLNPVTIGIALGLFVGKQLGVFGFCWVAIKLGVTRLPAGATWSQLYGVAMLCGVGFTMSLFVGSLAFENQDPAYQDAVKLGVLTGSIVSAVIGGWVLSWKTTADKDAGTVMPEKQAAAVAAANTGN